MTLPINGDGTIKLYDGKYGKLKNVSIVTRVRNRKHHLLQTLPTWLELQVQEIVIVDCSSDDSDLTNLLKYLKDDRIKVITLNNQKEFNRSLAWNIGIANAIAEWCLLLDCDIKITNDLFEYKIFSLPEYNNFFRFYATNLYGCSIILKNQWERIGGFNQQLKGWGWEDVDFYNRMKKEYKEITLIENNFEPIEHDNNERVSSHDEKDLMVSAAANSYRCRNIHFISLKNVESGSLSRMDISIPFFNYKQIIINKYPIDIINKFVTSGIFKQLVKKYNLFNTPEEIAKLFDTPEFIKLENKYVIRRNTKK